MGFVREVLHDCLDASECHYQTIEKGVLHQYTSNSDMSRVSRLNSCKQTGVAQRFCLRNSENCERASVDLQHGL
jgi:tartrate dehydratase alpha subunit/fumarate hydratase class I-like protein